MIVTMGMPPVHDVPPESPRVDKHAKCWPLRALIHINITTAPDFIRCESSEARFNARTVPDTRIHRAGAICSRMAMKVRWPRDVKVGIRNGRHSHQGAPGPGWPINHT